MSWNYRVMRHVNPETKEAWLAIHEYYYKSPGVPDGAWSEDPNPVTGETIHDLRQTLEWMLKALEKPVLDFEPNATRESNK